MFRTVRTGSTFTSRQARSRPGLGASPLLARHRHRPVLESLENRRLLATFVVNSTADDGSPGTLRWAISAANIDPVADQIVFRIPASTSPNLNVPVPGFDPATQTWRIQLNSPLPAITHPVSIDGYTQAHAPVPFRYPIAISSASQLISLIGSPTGGSFTLTTSAPLPVGTTAPIPYDASAATIRASLEAIVGVGNISVTGGPAPESSFVVSFINTYARQAIPNLSVTSSLIGGTSAGVVVETTTVGGVPTGNPTYILSSPSTLKAKEGNNAKIRIIVDGSLLEDATGFVIHASHTSLRGMMISNFDVGIAVPNPGSVGNLIQGNFIGNGFFYPVDVETGNPLPAPHSVMYTTGMGNSLQGVVLRSTNTTVGGSNPQESNVICGNGLQGVWIQPGGFGNQILGNQIGMAGPSEDGRYIQDGNGAEGVLIESSGSLADPLNIVFASSNFVGSATGGNLISGNGGAGIRLVGVGANRCLIQGNFIGVAPGGGYRFGTGNPGNAGDGILIEDGSQNLIGGATAALGNVITSNHRAGVAIVGSAASRNTITNNTIGLAFGGQQVLGNALEGVSIAAPSNTIGPGNVISANLRGIGIYGPGATLTVIRDNLIGTDSTGMQGLGNAMEGIRVVDSSENIIQGDARGSQVIASNDVGILLLGANSTGNRIRGNLIGTDHTGTHDLGNKNEGILIQGASRNVVGGNLASERNLIAANHWGVRIDGPTATRNVIQGNLIGTDISGQKPLGNEVNGVVISNNASNNLIGGASAEFGNIIAANVLDGVLIESGVANSILSNSIFSNGGLGIDLLDLADPPSGVTPNAPGIRSGPNNLQNAPVLTAAVSGGSRGSIQGVLNSIPNASFEIQFFNSRFPDPTGHGQGQILLGTTKVTTDGSGNAAFHFLPPSNLASNTWISATATNIATGDTSEFSNTLTALPVAVQFVASELLVEAGSGLALIRVRRTGNLSTTTSVSYATSNGTAIAESDYAATFGTLTFLPDEDEKSFGVTILVNPNQTANSVSLNLILREPTGGATLGPLDTAKLTIVNNLPPIVQFARSTYAASASANSALITVSRGGGNRNATVQVNYATTAGSAVPGLDYTPVAGTLTFLANQTSASFSIPLLPNSSGNGSKTIGLTLADPTAGAEIGSPSTATLTISSSTINPFGPLDVTAPRVIGQQLNMSSLGISSSTIGSGGISSSAIGSGGISSLTIAFSEPLDPARASELGNYGYHFVSAGGDGVFGTSDDGFVPLAAALYDPSTASVTLIPSSPLPANRFYRVTLNELANPLLGRGITDLAGNLLLGHNGVPSSPYVLTFATGTQLTYADSLGKTITLRLSGGGQMHMFQTVHGDVQSLTLVNTIPRKTTLLFHANNAGGRYTYLPPIQGSSGVRFRYRTPPFVFRDSMTPEGSTQSPRLLTQRSMRRR